MSSQPTVDELQYAEQQKLDTLRAKARARMAKNRALLKQKSAEEQEAARAKAREAQAEYRRRHRMRLRVLQRERRKLAYIAVHGEEAFELKHAERIARISAARESRRRARKLEREESTKRAAQAREKVLRRGRGTVS